MRRILSDNFTGLFSEELDPEVAALIGLSDDDGEMPDFSQLFDEPVSDDESESGDDVDMSIKTFTRPSKLEEEPKPIFNNKAYYKIALTGEGDASKRVHTVLGQFLQAEDPQDRSTHRSRMITAYWELFRGIAGKISANLEEPKRMLLRFGMLAPTVVSADQRTMLSKVILENTSGEPIYYTDEWLMEVAKGHINVSATDETRPSKRREPEKINAQLEKTRGKRDAQLNLIRTSVQEMEGLEGELREKIDTIANHDTRPEFDNLPAPYNELQRQAIGEISTIMRRLSTVNKELSRNYRELEGMQEHLSQLEEREEEVGAVQVDAKSIEEEANTIRQMTKLCVGRQGNHFPVLMKQYLRAALFNIGTRENVINVLVDVEYLDPGIFLRTFKMQTNRIVPNIVLLPCYGDQGICWEPFERYNRASSRGRLAVPMYPKDLRVAVISALGDLRWQIAKEKAQHYWMEEGLTGWYYQWFDGRKMRGDVKDAFIQDYVLWITKESEGTQKLEREVRDIFWRYMPFPQDVKDKLKNRGFVYAELHKKDVNRSMSDGY